MREFLPRVIGNAALRRSLGEELASGGFAHAYIIAGPEGIGKRTLAREIATAAACERRADGTVSLPCGTCPTCRKIRAGNCPDIVTVRKPGDKTTMGVDVIRAVREGISVVPNDLDIRVYLIEDADTMTVQAQNAFLLTLEEPPPFVLFLLLARDAGALLETIRSRAPILRMQPVAEEDVARALLSPDLPPETRREAERLKATAPTEFAALLKLSDGRIGEAISLLDPATREPLNERRETAEALCRLLADRSAEGVLLRLLSLGSAREEIVAQLSLFTRAVRDLILLTRSEEAPLLFFPDRDAALDLAARFPTERLFSILAATERALDTLAANGNVRLALTQLSVDLFPTPPNNGN